MKQLILRALTAGIVMSASVAIAADKLTLQLNGSHRHSLLAITSPKIRVFTKMKTLM